ncbi:MAG: ribulose-phosphate 3-epimerase [Dehalococcoidales bacterium]|jgi:ribulose-phosphate 3-epimerase|nr:ribulose phosphate epimerase [Dehalococcoidales bacterium]MDP6501686.1 ribulose-phosphate 3-epimerase [Dehalococcoidales bacterium]|tara:strand:+ start:493 stop:1152 length:660 start_codon:yes stop_codon:yes gene_type:complete
MAKLKKVIPAILAEDPKALETMVREAESFASYVQFDIMDGQFVPSRSITSQDLMAVPIKFSWEAHLMVERPEDYLNDCREAGAKKVVFHYEATSSPQSVISRARELGLEVGLAINPETDVPAFLPLVDEVDSVLFLTVHPGFYGSKFIPEVLDKVVELRQSRPSIAIGADGGIKESNIIQIAHSGVDEFCVGSAIFSQPKPAERYYHLVALIKEVSSPD